MSFAIDKADGNQSLLKNESAPIKKYKRRRFLRTHCAILIDGE